MISVKPMSRIPETSRLNRIRVSGHIIEVRGSETINDKMPILKVSDTEYAVCSTGELLHFEQSINRQENLSGIKESMLDCRSRINANFCGGINELWITLTYAENMTDPKRLYNDFKKFNQRLTYFMSGEKLSYIAIAEPQERGAWHLHCLYKYKDRRRRLFIDKTDLEGLWGHGFVNVKQLKDNDNIGAYISAYCSHLPSKDPKNKSYKKFQRLKLYPRGFNFFRCSRDIIKPDWQIMNLEQKEKIQHMKPDFSNAYEISNDGNVLQVVTYKQYNIKRQK